MLIRLLLAASLALPLLAQSQTNPGYGSVFAQGEVSRIDIAMDAGELAEMYASNSSATTYRADVAFANARRADTLRGVGIRLRGNTSLRAAKKNLKLDLNEYGNLSLAKLEKLNLNGEKNDPTLLRSRLTLELYRAAGVLASRAAHVEVYINGDYYGLYLNVEHVDEEFIERRFDGAVGNLYKCLYPATLEYRGPRGEDYQYEEYGRRVYDLRTNRDADDYADLARLMTVLHETPATEFECGIEAVFDVDAFLRVQAIDALTGNWDGYAYNVNNFYLYHDPATERFTYLPYDLDNTWGIDWVRRDWGTRDVNDWARRNVPRPLYERILAVQRYRDRYNFYLADYLERFFTTEHLGERIATLRALTAPAVRRDPLRGADFGWSVEDYERAFTLPLDPHVDYGLESFVAVRGASARRQISNRDIVPHLFEPTLDHVFGDRATAVSVAVAEAGGLRAATLNYRLDGGAWQAVPLADDGSGVDAVGHYGTFSGTLPVVGMASTLDYFFSATDDGGQTGRLPWCGHWTRDVAGAGSPVRINEVMAANDATVADESGEYDDWVELYNASDVHVDLGGMTLTDNAGDATKWTLPGVTLAAGAHLLIWTDDDSEQGDLHANFKLDADGEEVALYEATGQLADRICFGASDADVAFARIPDGNGALATTTQPTPGAPNASSSTVVDHGFRGWLSVAPNPTAGPTTLSVGTVSTQTLTWRLTDVGGRGLQRGYVHRADHAQRALDLSAYPAGVYWVVVERDARAVALRAVVKQ